VKHWLWRAVDQTGIVLDVLVQRRRDKQAAKRLLRKLLKKQMRPPRVSRGETHGCEILGVPRVGGTLDVSAIRTALGDRGLSVVFVEGGGGITISHFLEAGCLNRLQITVAPIIIGSYFRNAFARNAGLRIDHLLLSPAIGGRLVAAEVDRDIRGRERASDHAPVWIELAEAKGRVIAAAPPARRLSGNRPPAIQADLQQEDRKPKKDHRAIRGRGGVTPSANPVR
jgi:DDE domain/RibD C-terminal domain